MHDVLGDQLVVAAISSWLVQLTKTSKYFPWISVHTEKANKLFSAAVAALSTAGILVSATWVSDSHTFTFVVANLSIATVFTFVWHWAGQYVFMKGVYKLAFRGTNGTAAKI